MTREEIKKFKHEEYIGDAVLELVVREHCPKICGNSLYTSNRYLIEVALDLKIVPSQHFFDSAGKELIGKNYADEVEAIIGRIYLEHGLEEVRVWVVENILFGRDERYARLKEKEHIKIQSMERKLTPSEVQEYYNEWNRIRNRQ